MSAWYSRGGGIYWYSKCASLFVAIIFMAGKFVVGHVKLVVLFSSGLGIWIEPCSCDRVNCVNVSG